MPLSRLGNCYNYRREKRQNNDKAPSHFRWHARKQKPAQNDAKVCKNDAELIEHIGLEVLGGDQVCVSSCTREQIEKQVSEGESLEKQIENQKRQRRESGRVEDDFQKGTAVYLPCVVALLLVPFKRRPPIKDDRAQGERKSAQKYKANSVRMHWNPKQNCKGEKRKAKPEKPEEAGRKQPSAYVSPYQIGLP